MTIPTEHAEQVTFFNELERRWPDIRAFAIPNGGFRHKRTAEMLKTEGVKKGVPDIFIPELRLFIEMKRIKNSTTSKEQTEWIQYLRSVGYRAEIAKGWQEAIKIVENLTTNSYN